MAGVKNKIVRARRAVLLIVSLAFIFFQFACANIYTARGIYHRFQKGESLAKLAETYRVSIQDLAELNDIEDPTQIKLGRSIFIPGVKAKSFKSSKWPTSKKKKTAKKGSQKVKYYHGKFDWPIPGKVTSRFGVRRGRRHDGIDIKSPRGTKVRASANGTVVYAKRMRGYGNLILLKHSKNFFTVYAHNSVNSVRKGARIKKGQVIAKVGSTGRATGPHLHFEVREGRKPRNPLFFLPKRR